MKITRVAMCVVVLFGWASGVDATPVISGTLAITGTVTISATAIDWAPPGGGSGTFDVNASSTGYFAAVATSPATFRGDVSDLAFASPPPPLPAGFGVDNFLGNLRLIAGGTPAPAPFDAFHFDLADISTPAFLACTGSEGAGQSCRLGLLTLTNLGAGLTLLRADVKGFFEDEGLNCLVTPTPAHCTPASGGYLTTVGSSIQNLAAIFGAGGNIPTTYSGTFTSQAVPAVPEPGTIALMIPGAVWLAARVVRRRSSAR